VPIIARTLIAELPELGALDGKQIASLGGLAPFTVRSTLFLPRSPPAVTIPSSRPSANASSTPAVGRPFPPIPLEKFARVGVRKQYWVEPTPLAGPRLGGRGGGLG
jgi:hypothetical protein